MGVDFCTDLVDENWIRELVAAWTARDAKQPIPAVRWPDPERTLVYLSNSPYDWPEQFRKMLEALAKPTRSPTRGVIAQRSEGISPAYG